MSSRLGETITEPFYVQDGANPITGLTQGDFTVLLHRNTAVATETVTIVEVEEGGYAAVFTPTTDIVGATFATYLLVIKYAGAVSVLERTFQVYAQGAEIPVGPAASALTTREHAKLELKIEDDEHDDRIDRLIAEVTTDALEYWGRAFFYDSFTQLLDGGDARCLFLREIPIASVTALWVSQDIPRVYDATTLLVEGTDFVVEKENGIIERLSGCFPRGPQTVKCTYAGGYADVPGSVERAAIEIISVKLHKGAGNLYHVVSENRGDGSATFGSDQFSRFDWPLHAKQVFDRYRLPRAA